MATPDYSAAVRLYQAGLSCKQVADRLQRPTTTVYKWLKRAGIQLRSRSAAAKHNTLTATSRLQTTVDGLLLGGAHIDTDGRLTVLHRDHAVIETVRVRLQALGVRTYAYKHGLRTGRYATMRDYRQRWVDSFPPVELRLEPVTLAMWYALTNGEMILRPTALRDLVSTTFGWRVGERMPGPPMRDRDQQEVLAIIRPHLSSVSVSPRRVRRPQNPR